MIDELQRVRKFRAAEPPPSEAATTAARAALLQLIRDEVPTASPAGPERRQLVPAAPTDRTRPASAGLAPAGGNRGRAGLRRDRGRGASGLTDRHQPGVGDRRRARAARARGREPAPGR